MSSTFPVCHYLHKPARFFHAFLELFGYYFYGLFSSFFCIFFFSIRKIGILDILLGTLYCTISSFVKSWFLYKKWWSSIINILFLFAQFLVRNCCFLLNPHILKHRSCKNICHFTLCLHVLVRLPIPKQISVPNA